jgi:hypothetical protein
MILVGWEQNMRNTAATATSKPEESFRRYTPDARTILDIVYRSRQGCLYVSNRDAHHANSFLRPFPEDPQHQEPTSSRSGAEILKAMAAKGCASAMEALSRAIRRP